MDDEASYHPSQTLTGSHTPTHIGNDAYPQKGRRRGSSVAHKMDRVGIHTDSMIVGESGMNQTQQYRTRGLLGGYMHRTLSSVGSQGN